MNKSLLAVAAFVAGAAIGAPMLAWSAADTPQSAQSTLAQSAPMQPHWDGGPGGNMGGDPGAEGRGGRQGGMQQGGEQRQGGWWHHGWMHRAMEMSPQQRCEERLARRAGFRAYIVAKLDLTQQQRPLWDKLAGILQTADDQQRQLCATLKPMDQRQSETMLDRIQRREKFLSAKLQELQSVDPALKSLYDTLTPDQKTMVDHPFHRS